MAGVLSGIGIASHAVAAVAFAGLATLLAARRGREPFAMPVTLAAAISALWAASAAIVYLSTTVRNPWVGHAETLRTAAWIGVLILIVHRPLGFDRKPSSSFMLAAALGFIVALDFVLGAALAGAAARPAAFLLFVATRIVLAISGLVLLHNIYVSAQDGGGPGFRFLAIGIGVIFAYDLNLYTLQFLLGEAPSSLINSRGIANALAVPLILLAFREDKPGGFSLSREVAFNTISFSVIGLYLIVMSVLAYFLRLAGGNWGVVLQVSFLTLTMILGALVILSPRFRAVLRVWISRNFYRYRYDYRKEWLGFIDKVAGDGKAMAASLAGAQPIRERIVEATASVLGSPGGALFEPGPTGVFQQTARWHWRSLEVEELGEEFLPSSTLGHSLGTDLRILDFDDLRVDHASHDGGKDGEGAPCPAWALADRSIWLAVPMVHRGRLIAILLLERSPVVRDLNWEDYDLLRTLGQQGASYLAEAAAQAALDEAQAFDEFNRRFAFVMHDLKNVVSQLGLVSRNARKHMDNAEFREDLMATLDASVTKMRDLLALLGKQSAGGLSQVRAETKGGDVTVPAAASGELADLAEIARDMILPFRRQHSALELEGAGQPLFVAGDAGRLAAMLTHLVQNAIDASPAGAPIRVTLKRHHDNAVITVRDRGHGMSATFIRDELFKPFRSSKEGGFGIGAFEAREIARAHGGRIDVASKPGEGTRFTITLPLAQAHGKTLAAA
ncbi:XrtA/PEP-CTERM system histidine kinase PrsK [Thermaurantiacus sp.]